MNELGSDARELLARLGDADGPSAAQTARMKRKLGVALGAAGGVLALAGATGAAKAAASAAAAGAAASAGTKLGGAGLGGLLSMFALGAAAGVGVSTSTLVLRHYFEPPAPVVASSAPALAPQPRANSTALPAEPAAAVVAELAPPGEVAAAPAPVALAPSEQPVAAPSAVEPTLGPEVELVIAAKRELTLGRPSQALALVERLAAEFPNGALREERRLLKVLSLCALGQVEQARREARDFAATAPRSPLLPRLEQSCGGAAIAGPKPAR
jgi:hypothetical protein